MTRPDKATVLTKALLRASSRLGVTDKALAKTIGVSVSTVSRMRAGRSVLRAGHKSFELAVLFLRLHQSLDAMVGGDDAAAGCWLRGRNTRLDAEPRALLQTVSGLMNVLQYLEARRTVCFNEWASEADRAGYADL